MKLILLDSGPLGILTNPNVTQKTVHANRWFADHLAAGNRFFVPEITDYETRREFILIGSHASIVLLDNLIAHNTFLPLSTNVMHLAANLWALARQMGLQTAPNHSIDIDVILAAQAISLNDPSVVIATKNVNHLGRFAPAEDWQFITP